MTLVRHDAFHLFTSILPGTFAVKKKRGERTSYVQSDLVGALRVVKHTKYLVNAGDFCLRMIREII